MINGVASVLRSNGRLRLPLLISSYIVDTLLYCCTRVWIRLMQDEHWCSLTWSFFCDRSWKSTCRVIAQGFTSTEATKRQMKSFSLPHEHPPHVEVERKFIRSLITPTLQWNYSYTEGRNKRHNGRGWIDTRKKKRQE